MATQLFDVEHNSFVSVCVRHILQGDNYQQIPGTHTYSTSLSESLARSAKELASAFLPQLTLQKYFRLQF